MLNGNIHQQGSQNQRALQQNQGRTGLQGQTGSGQQQVASTQPQEGLLGLTQGQTLLEAVPGGEIITGDRRMKEVIQLAVNVSQSKATVLIQGESGTGKELIARAIHVGSHRSEAMFLPYNCTTTGRDLADSQLFGHRRGAFTGAISDQPGLIQIGRAHV